MQRQTMESVFPWEEHGMNETVKICFGLIGGLALFLYGMNTMSDALQKCSCTVRKQATENKR